MALIHCRGIPRMLMGLAFAATAHTVAAAPVTINFTADFGLDLSQPIAGTTLGTLIDTTYGSGTGTASNVSVSGSLTFDNATAPYQELHVGSQGIANYLGPITGGSLQIWGASPSANISGTASSDPFLLQTDVSATRGCLGLVIECQGTPTANAALVNDNALVTVVDTNGSQTFASRDSLSFGLGFTSVDDALVDAFMPAIFHDDDDNSLRVWGLRLTVVGKPGEELWFSTTLPSNASFFDPDLIDYLSISIGLIGVPQGTLDGAFLVPLEGNASSYSVTQIDDHPSNGNTVPEPTSLVLCLTSGALLAGFRKRRKVRQ